MMRAALFAATAWTLLSAPALADPWADVEVLDDADMADIRGGFVLPNGVEVNFAATVSTYSNDALALRTDLVLNDAGYSMQQHAGELGIPLQDLTEAQRAEYGLVGIGDSGVVIVDSTGITALVQNVSGSGLHNIVFNTGDGRALRQEIDVTITLPGFLDTQRAIGDEIVGIRIGGDLDSWLVTAPGG